MKTQEILNKVGGFYARLSPKTRRIAVYATAASAVILAATIATVLLDAVSDSPQNARKRAPEPEKFVLMGRDTGSIEKEEVAAKEKQAEEFMKKILSGELDINNLRPQDIPPGLENQIRQIIADRDGSSNVNTGAREKTEVLAEMEELDLPVPKSVAKAESATQVLVPNAVPPPKPRNERVKEAEAFSGTPTPRDVMASGDIGVGTQLGSAPSPMPDSAPISTQDSGAIPAQEAGNGGTGRRPVAIREVDSSTTDEDEIASNAEFESTGRSQRNIKNTEQKVTVEGPRGVIRETEDVKGRIGNKKSEEDDAIYIPAGSIVGGVMISGMEAFTSNQARRDPFPTLVRINQEALLPNRFRMDLRQCFLLAEGYGDLSSERVMLRSTVLSCVRNDGGIIEVPFQSFAVGEDGLSGLRGELITRNGQLIATSLMAGIAQGLTEAFKPARVPSLNLQPGGVQQFETVAPNDAAKQSALGGINAASSQIAEYYLEMAKNIFPVVKVNAGRKVDFVITKGVKLNSLSASKGNRRQVRDSRSR